MPLRFSKSGIEAGTISWSALTWLGIAMVCFWHMLAVRLDGDMDKYVIGSDGSGYYAYLPASFIYHDFSYSFADPNAKGHLNYYGTNKYKFVSRNKDGKLNNKYFIGTSVLMFPFFVLALFFSWISGYPLDGYSFLFQSFLCIAGIFYLLAGLWFIRKLLLRTGMRDGVISAVMACIFLGTNLYHYALEEPTMSHVYSFAVISFFIYHAYCFFDSSQRKHFVCAATAFTLIVAIRPSNSLIVLSLPFLFLLTGKKMPDIAGLLKSWKSIWLPLLTGSALLFLQLYAYKLTVGKWTTDSYTGENFDFTRSHMADVLFSWRKGLFIYSPMIFVSLAGLFFTRNFKASLAFFLFFIINTWFISCWHDWGYGGSLGHRPFIDYYPLFAITLAFLFRFMTNRFAAAGTAIVCLFLVSLNISQHYQYHFGILPYDQMTAYKYKRLFFQHNKIFSGIFPPEKWASGVVPEHSRQYAHFVRHFENDTIYRNNTGVVTDKISFSPPGAVMLSDSVKVSPDLYLPINGTIPDSLMDRTWIEVKLKVWLTDEISDAKLVISFFDDQSNYSWNGRFIIHRVDQAFAWKPYMYALKVPPPPSGNGRISVYVLKDDHQPVYIDDLEVSFWAEPAKK